METNALTPSTLQTTTPIPASADKAETNISADFETFLKMLTVQMQNQDPLNPIDSSDYAVQLATFSGVEQQVQTNDLLEGLAAAMGASGLSEMAGWVGMDARAPGPAYFGGAPLTVVPAPDAVADASQLVVRDENGVEMQRIDISTSSDPVVWAGVGDNGNPLPNGAYTFVTENFALGRPISENKSEVYQRVTEVQFDGSQNILIMDGNLKVSATDITALRDPATSG